MSFDELAIRVVGLSKRYEIYKTPGMRLKQFIFPRLRRFFGLSQKQYFDEFWALKDVSFEVKKGETIGIIGRNGSGKSTLLQLICGTLTPTSGDIGIKGRVAALLELGSGFNPEFTGRENVYLNAAVLGLSKKEIDDRFHQIVEFSEIGRFIDQQVKTYSSGMYVRLAFSIIAHVDADILVVDEALSVGDIFFQQKCMRFLRDFQIKEKTIIFVSHDTSAVASLCKKSILLNAGNIVCIGLIDEVFKTYIENLYSEKFSVKKSIISKNMTAINFAITDASNLEKKETIFKSSKLQENKLSVSLFQSNTESFGSLDSKILNAWFESEAGLKIHSMSGGESVCFCIYIQAQKDILYPAFGFIIKDRLGQFIIAEGTDLAFRDQALKFNKGEFAIARFSFIMPTLINGDYTVNIAFAEGKGDDHVQHHWINDALIINSRGSRLVQGIYGLQNMEITVQVIPKKL